MINSHPHTYAEAALLVERLQEELLATRPTERRPTLRYVARYARGWMDERMSMGRSPTHHRHLWPIITTSNTTPLDSASPGSRTTPRRAT